MRVAILGGGIMGTCTALFLARMGAHVTLYDQMSAPMEGASRWNEGKIHLGYLYGADPSLQSCRKVLPGGLLFIPIVEDLIGESTSVHLTQEDDIILFHRDSVIGLEQHRDVLNGVSHLIRSHPDTRCHPGNLAAAEARPLTASDLARFSCSGDIVAAYRVPERSLDTRWLADRLVEAVAAEERIEVWANTRVTAVIGEDGGDNRWRVACKDAEHRGYDAVVNALWNGRLAIDHTVGLEPGAIWSNRYRVAAFVETIAPVHTRSTLICVGAFGDIKNFGDHRFYVSWYPSGLLLDSSDLDPASPAPLSPEERASKILEIRKGLGAHVPGIDEIFDAAEDVRIEGGFVFAEGGKGRIDERGSTLHARDRFGVRRKGSYLSVDTGKWSTAPLMAYRLACSLMGLPEDRQWCSA